MRPLYTFHTWVPILRSGSEQQQRRFIRAARSPIGVEGVGAMKVARAEPLDGCN